jgi:very-short-patch-repair endonuclease
MSLNKENSLIEIAKVTCRELRKRSTNAERILWKYVRGEKLSGCKFYRQYPIFYDVTGKESFFVADFYYHKGKLVIELDGSIHNYKVVNDKAREGILNSLGIKVIRFKNDEVETKLEEVLEKIKGNIPS